MAGLKSVSLSVLGLITSSCLLFSFAQLVMLEEAEQQMKGYMKSNG